MMIIIVLMPLSINSIICVFLGQFWFIFYLIMDVFFYFFESLVIFYLMLGILNFIFIEYWMVLYFYKYFWALF